MPLTHVQHTDKDKDKYKYREKIYNICETGTQIVARSILTILLMPLTHVQQIDNDKD